MQIFDTKSLENNTDLIARSFDKECDIPLTVINKLKSHFDKNKVSKQIKIIVRLCSFKRISKKHFFELIIPVNNIKNFRE